ncbi:hypothetical protein Q5P01_013916 [Channa striata]|uniref:G-protein coupled receptors family 1 profile domain-containing protein n=1 Tax=Channa striata TaxID=64152 RepID=A0AA88ML52_CHASR|nr:hypothetical protein Q5P01_013916 [Channa striata]
MYNKILEIMCKKLFILTTDVFFTSLTMFLNVKSADVPHIRHITLHECLILYYMSLCPCRQLHTPSNLLILSLSVSDSLLGLVTIVEAHRQTDCWFVGDLMCSLHVYVASISLSASVGVMVLISVDRYVAICDPLHYPTRVTVTRVKMCVCMCWIGCFVYVSGFLYENLAQPGLYNTCYGQCVVRVGYSRAYFDVALSFIAPITVIIILYMRVFVTAVSQARAMRSHVAAVTLQCSGTVTTKKSELKAARTLGVVVLVYLICYCPYYVLCLITCDSDLTIPPASVVFMMCISPCLNPVIYALFYPWFRKALRLIFSLQILQPGSRETNML